MDRLIISQLNIPVILGVLEDERIQPQDIIFDVEVELDISKASSTDNIANVNLDYRLLCDKLMDYVANTEFQLIETLVEKTAEFILSQFSVSSVKLTLTKKPADISFIDGVSIVIER